jgi:hypothetical protein
LKKKVLLSKERSSTKYHLPLATSVHLEEKKKKLSKETGGFQKKKRFLQEERWLVEKKALLKRESFLEKKTLLNEVQEEVVVEGKEAEQSC